MSQDMIKKDMLKEIQQGGAILSEDILIPRLLLMQALSDLVVARAATSGDIVKSINKEVIASPEKPAEFIPLRFENTWIIETEMNNKWVYFKKVPREKEEGWSKDYLGDADGNPHPTGGALYRKKKNLNLYALLVSDIVADSLEKEKVTKGEIPDLDKALLPVLISFKSTSFPAAKKLMTYFALAREFKAPIYCSKFKLKSVHTKNDKGQYYVYDTERVGSTPKEYLPILINWASRLGQVQVTVDESLVDTSESTDVSL